MKVPQETDTDVEVRDKLVRRWKARDGESKARQMKTAEVGWLQANG